MKRGLLLLSLIAFLASCQSEEELAPQGEYTFQKPENFPEPTYTFENNPVTKEGFLLGRKLFFDPNLSRDGSVSCNTCHIQSTAFADAQQHPISIGIDGRIGIRNAPSIANMAFYPEFFWDGGVTHLDFVPIVALEAEFEMDESLPRVVEKLNNDPDYRTMFKEAFDIEEITLPYTLHAFSQFMTMMVSANSKYDKFIRGEGETFTDLELEGMALFKQKCGSCHGGELFTDFSYQNNGLTDNFTDTGRERISEFEGDRGKFRVPSLRNVGFTAPYMHNAKFWTLEEVLDHYDSGVVDSPTLSNKLRDPETGELGIPLTKDEKTKIIAFLHTLSDYDFRMDTRFQN
ncbi:MAG: cytochrome c peroxidase [Bacteroidota bacterium]